MSDKIITLNDHTKGHAGRSRDQEPIPINARLQWVADLVCAILDAESYPGCGEHQTLIVNGE
jgi:hypothetical protein